MCSKVEVRLEPDDRGRREGVLADRNLPQKHVWRARIILAAAEGCGTAGIMRCACVAKLCVWRWQRRFMEEGVDGLWRDKTHKPGKEPVAEAVVEQLVERTPGETTHWTNRGDGQAHGPGDQQGAEDLVRPRPGTAPAANLEASKFLAV